VALKARDEVNRDYHRNTHCEWYSLWFDRQIWAVCVSSCCE